MRDDNGKLRVISKGDEMFRRIGLFAVCLAACTVPATMPDASPEITEDAWRFKDHASAIRQASCGQSEHMPMMELPISVDPVDLNGELEGLTYVGGWHLSSDHEGFGGLSGLDMTDEGDLLAVTDGGVAFVINIEGDRPAEVLTAVQLRGADGQFLAQKSEKDAEGLAYHDGIALISFERDHRILGFAFGQCGSIARGVEITQLPAEQGFRRFNANRGAEALSLSDDGLLTFGYEKGIQESAPLGIVYADGSTGFTEDADAPGGFAQVGRDQHGSIIAELFRSYSPIRGNRNVIRVGQIEARMASPMTVDNFEGIALQELEDGTLRIWIISDDNYNRKSQRTLLMAFNVIED